MPVYTAKSGSIRISVLRNGPGRFVVAWYPVIGGRRTRETFGTKKAACDRADEIAAALASGQADVLTLTSADRDSYRTAIQTLAPLGIPLHAAIAEYVASKKALPHIHDSLIEAAAARSKAAAVVPCPPTATLIDPFIATKEDDHRSDIYIRGLKQDLKRFAEAFPDLPALTDTGFRAFLRVLKDKRTGEPVSDRRRDNVRATVITFCNFVAKQKLLAQEIADLAAGVPAIAKRGDVTTFTPAELLQVLTYFDSTPEDRMWLPWAAIAAFAGLRTSEIYRLEWGPRTFKWERGFIAISDKVADKLDLARHAPLLPVLSHWLAPWRHATGLVLPRPGDCSWRALEERHSRARKRLCKALGWPRWKANALRHSFGSHRLGILGDIALVAGEMGNSPSEVRQSYNDSKDPVEAAEYFQTGLPTEPDTKIIHIPA